MRKPPFFIIGCVRSGTTLLRDLLRAHPNLVAPEETHFYRWPHPFGTSAFTQTLLANRTLIRHRKIDGIEEAHFAKILDGSTSRADLYIRYMRAFRKTSNSGFARWFDKTPQNVYGAAMLVADFPRSKILHIVRNPLDVAASLRAGGVMHVPELKGACNYWREAVAIVATIKRATPKRIMELRYEDLTSEPLKTLNEILDFLGEDFEPGWFSKISVSPRTHPHESIFSERERHLVSRICGSLASIYDYSI